MTTLETITQECDALYQSLAAGSVQIERDEPYIMQQRMALSQWEEKTRPLAEQIDSIVKGSSSLCSAQK